MNDLSRAAVKTVNWLVAPVLMTLVAIGLCIWASSDDAPFTLMKALAFIAVISTIAVWVTALLFCLLKFLAGKEKIFSADPYYKITTFAYLAFFLVIVIYPATCCRSPSFHVLVWVLVGNIATTVYAILVVVSMGRVMITAGWRQKPLAALLLLFAVWWIYQIVMEYTVHLPAFVEHGGM